MRVIVFFLIGLCLATPARAGAWLREDRAGFLSFSVEYSPKWQSTFTALYAEYGLGRRITAGLDLGFSDERLYKGVLFGRMALVPPDGTWKLAAELGIGTTEDEPVLRPGLSLGRSLQFGPRPGWLAVDALARYEIEKGNVEFTVDTTIGVQLSEKRKFLLQLQSGNHPMDPDYLNLAPSLVIERQPGLHLEIGMKAGLKERDDYAVKLGIWRYF